MSELNILQVLVLPLSIVVVAVSMLALLQFKSVSGKRFVLASGFIVSAILVGVDLFLFRSDQFQALHFVPIVYLLIGLSLLSRKGAQEDGRKDPEL